MPRPTTADGYVHHVGHHYPFVSSHAPPILHRRKRVVEAMYYYPSVSSRAATIS
jgi:hypothetical protein